MKYNRSDVNQTKAWINHNYDQLKNLNYNDWMERELNLFPNQKTILLHSCCGPCSTAVIDALKDYFHITILYYNPNIEPLEEYLKRKEEQIRYIKESKLGIEFMDCDYDNESFKEIAKNLKSEPEGGARCYKCYYLRLRKTAELALNNHFDYFGTTLTVSPYKNAKVINMIGLELEKTLNKDRNEEEKVLFLISDFKKKEGYKKSIALAKKYNLYRQEYCGCLYGKENRSERENEKI